MPIRRVMQIKGIQNSDTESRLKSVFDQYGLGCIGVNIEYNSSSGLPTGRASIMFENDEQGDRELNDILEVDHLVVVKSDKLKIGIKKKQNQNDPLNPVAFANKIHDAHFADHPSFGDMINNGGLSVSNVPLQKKIKKSSKVEELDNDDDGDREEKKVIKKKKTIKQLELFEESASSQEEKKTKPKKKKVKIIDGETYLKSKKKEQEKSPKEKPKKKKEKETKKKDKKEKKKEEKTQKPKKKIEKKKIEKKKK